MSITDKELLTFCNLANLEMEYANIIKSISYTPVYNEKGEVTGQNENITNHTIYTFL